MKGKNIMTNHPLSNQLMRALLARFEADRQEALATIELFLGAPVGVSDHSNVLEDLRTATARLSAAEEALETLNRNFLAATDTDDDDE